MKQQLIEITIIHNTNIIKVLFNYPNIEVFKKSFEYQVFKDIHGDILYSNLTNIEINPKTPNYHIYMSYLEPLFDKEHFSKTVNDVINLLNINHKFKNTIILKILEKCCDNFETNCIVYLNIINKKNEIFIAFNSINYNKYQEEDSEFISVSE